jgi:5-methylcytosine-specific restriction protein B
MFISEEVHHGQGKNVNPSSSEGASASACWFVGATYGGRAEDQVARFVKEGIWENGYHDRYLEVVKSVQAGDRIAIKSSYTQKLDLPFENHGKTVSVMSIKAIGIVQENPGDGRILKVTWQLLDNPRKWYFYTNRTTIWRVMPGEWDTDALIAFAFTGSPQDLDRFRNAPYWKDRFGDITNDKQRFKWTQFYEVIADNLLAFRSRRSDLIAGIHALASKVDGLANLQDQFKDGTTGPLRDICPFTTIGIINRGITESNRKHIAAELAKLLNVSEPVPDSFEGIPVLNNQMSWFFAYESKRRPEDIDNLWEIFAQAIRFADTEDADTRTSFIAAYDKAASAHGVKWNLTMGLYWIRPWSFPTLDSQSQRYITQKLNTQIGMSGPKHSCSANEYLSVLDTLEARFQEDAYPVHSFPELSLAAWRFKDGAAPTQPAPATGDDPDDGSEPGPEATTISVPLKPYSIDDIIAEGCFIPRAKLEMMLSRLRTKKNIILQGPPGTGKTWVAKRLAFALMGQRDENRLRAVQFHPNLSYEDFVRGWRPSGEGKLSLVDGPFIEMVKEATKEPKVKHVVVIEEINRGNPAQIFGEMLTLLEVDKRTPSEALELCYRRSDGERIFIPNNLHVIGTMNVADRSIALVDLALRRRFAFIDLEPALGDDWRAWVHSKCGISTDILEEIERRVGALNLELSSDSQLGPQFRIGHSYVTPPFDMPIEDGREWYRQVVGTEIGPLLDEYWFDQPEKSQKARARLLEGF